MSKILDLAVIRDATANLQRIAADHPELLGKSAPEDWERILLGLQNMSEEKTATPGKDRQRKLREKRIEQGLCRFEIWLSPESVKQLKTTFAGPRNGILWQEVIDAALTHAKPHQGKQGDE